MKKLSLYLMFVIAGWSLISCDESHDDYTMPTNYEQEEVFGEIEGFEATATSIIGNNINLDTLTKYDIDSVQLFTLKKGNLPNGITLGNVRFEAWPSNKSEYISTKVTVSENGWVKKDTLAKLVYSFYGKKATERIFNAKLYANAIKGTEAQLIELGAFLLKITPQEVENPYYYVYGNAISNKRADAEKTVMTPDPENDVVYSYTTYYVSMGDIKIWNSKYWMAEKDKDDEDVDYSMLYGSGEATGQNYKKETGNLAQGVTGEMPFISSPSKGYYTFIVNLEDRNYKWVKLENQTPSCYDVISVTGSGFSYDMEGTDYVSGYKTNMAKGITHHNWFVKLTLSADTQLKFTANHDASINWGFGSADGEWTVNDDRWANPCTTDGMMITVPEGKYNVYFCDITGVAHFVPID